MSELEFLESKSGNFLDSGNKTAEMFLHDLNIVYVIIVYD